ncbi:MAG: hypothetical protein JXR76_26475 [Deltaproteobacteria bacterium]|nr:hypothetical protein [Deltaproteobacteria bacterium]
MFHHLTKKIIPMLLFTLLSGCAASQSYVASDVGSIDIQNTTAHQFIYVRAYEEDNQLVIYGKIHHNHQGPHTGEAVLLQGIDDKTGAETFRNSITLRPQSNRLRGWYGAGFRARIEMRALKQGKLAVSFTHITATSLAIPL